MKNLKDTQLLEKLVSKYGKTNVLNKIKSINESYNFNKYDFAWDVYKAVGDIAGTLNIDHGYDVTREDFEFAFNHFLDRWFEDDSYEDDSFDEKDY